MTSLSRDIGHAHSEALAGIHREHAIRIEAASIVLVFLTLAFFGAAWDIQWHAVVGRDSFWIPPHLFLYSGVVLSGITCIATVLGETWRYYRGDPAVSSVNTTRFLGIFRGPLGIIVSGLGLTTMLAAAPFDDWWHRMYGIDVTVWSPPHLLGIAGAVTGMSGAVIAFASEANRHRSRIYESWGFIGWGISPAVWLLLIALQASFAGYGIVFVPAAAQSQYLAIWLGPWRIIAYPVLLAAGAALMLVAAVTGTRRIGAATVTALIFVLMRTIMNLFVPLAMDIVVPLVGEHARSPLREVVVSLGYPALLPLAGILIDLGALAVARLKFPLLPVMVALGSLSALLLAWLEQPWARVARSSFPTAVTFQTIILVIVFGAVAALLGTLYGRLLNRVQK